MKNPLAANKQLYNMGWVFYILQNIGFMHIYATKTNISIN